MIRKGIAELGADEQRKCMEQRSSDQHWNGTGLNCEQCGGIAWNCIAWDVLKSDGKRIGIELNSFDMDMSGMARTRMAADEQGEARQIQ